MYLGRLLMRLQHLLCMPPSPVVPATISRCASHHLPLCLPLSPNLPAISSHFKPATNSCFACHELPLYLTPAPVVPATSSCCANHQLPLCLPPLSIVPAFSFRCAFISPCRKFHISFRFTINCCTCSSSACNKFKMKTCLY